MKCDSHFISTSLSLSKIKAEMAEKFSVIYKKLILAPFDSQLWKAHFFLKCESFSHLTIFWTCHCIWIMILQKQNLILFWFVCCDMILHWWLIITRFQFKFEQFMVFVWQLTSLNFFAINKTKFWIRGLFVVVDKNF